jgi:uncharacterized protein with GYD domain
MSTYLIQVAYSSDTWSKLVANPQNRFQAISTPIENLGGKLLSAYFAFGDYDAVCIIEMPSQIEIAAIALAFAAGGACKSVKTTPLMTAAEGIEALKKAAKCGYKAPTAKAASAR